MSKMNGAIDVAKPLNDAGTSSSTTLQRQREPASNCLLIINKGPGALKIEREGSSWDLMEIFFSNSDIATAKSDPSFSAADHVVFETDRNMRKFAIIKRVFEQYPVFSNYKVVMMLDDDLVPVGCSFTDIFDLFLMSGFRVGQPALTPDSYWSHEIVLQNDNFKWRRTNFVEVMCPIMTMDAIQDYMPVFDATTSSFGLDIFWSTHEWKKHGGVIVLDSTPMRHTRPVRGGIAYNGVSPEEDRLAFVKKHHLKNYRHLTIGGEMISSGAIVNNIRISYWSQFWDIVKFNVKSFLQSSKIYSLLAAHFVHGRGRDA